MSTNFSELLTLGISERIQLVEDLWDSIAAESQGLPLHDWQRAELARREAEYAADPTLASTWEEAKERILARHGR
jgi:putative addiction module component (TIGR02574 family)